MAGSTGNVIELLLKLNIGDFLAKFNQASQAGKNNLGQLQQTSQKTAAETDKAFETLGIRPFTKIRAEITQVEAAYKHLASTGTLSIGELSKAKDAARQKIADLKQETNGWANQLGGLQNNLGGLVAAFGSLLVVREANSAFSDFEQKMAEVNTLLNLGREPYEALKRTIGDLSTRVPQTAKELANAAYDLVSSGVELKELPKALELSAKAAVAGVTDTQTAVNVGIGVINAYGLKLSELGNVYDLLFQVVKDGVVTFPQLAQYIGEVLPIARAAGVSLNEVGAAVAQLTKAGIRAPEAVTALKDAIQQLSIPGPEAKKEMDALGLSWKGLIATLSQIKSLNLSNEQLKKIIPDVRGITAVLSLTQNFDGLITTLGHVSEAAGSTQTAYDIMAKTPENQVKMLGNEFNTLMIQLGAFLSQGLLPVVEGLKDLTAGLKDADTPTKILVGTITTGAAGFILWEAGLGKIVLALVALRAKILEAATASATLNTALKANVVLAAAFSVYEVGKFIQAFFQLGNVQTQLARQGAAYGEAAKEFAKYKDVQILGLKELQAKSQDELEAYKQNLKGKLQYLGMAIAQMGALSEQSSLLGNPTEESKQAQKELDKLNAEYAKVKEGIKALEQVGTQAMDQVGQHTDGAKEKADALKRANEQLKEGIQDVKRAGDSIAAELGKAYDFAAQKAKALATTEADGAQAALLIEKQKVSTLIGEANATYWNKLELIHNSLADAKTAAEEEKRITLDLQAAKMRALDEWRSKLQQAYLSAASDYNKYAAGVKQGEADLKDSQASTEEQLRDLKRRTMTDEQAWLDKRQEAYENLQKAQTAIASAKTPDQFKEAADMARKAQGEFKALAGEVTNGDQVVISEAESVKEASDGVALAGETIAAAVKQGIEAQRQLMDAAKQRMVELQQQLTNLQTQIDKINQTPVQPQVQFQVDQGSVDGVNQVRDELGQPISVKVYYDTSDKPSSSESSYHQGGWVGTFHGGGLTASPPSLSQFYNLKPGEILAKLLKTEFVFSPQATRVWGPWLDAMNKLRITPEDLFGRMSMPELPKFHDGGPVGVRTGGLNETITLRLQTGSVELPVVVSGSNPRGMVQDFAKELEKLRLTRGSR